MPNCRQSNFLDQKGRSTAMQGSSYLEKQQLYPFASNAHQQHLSGGVAGSIFAPGKSTAAAITSTALQPS
jgi:hypothetical protein